MAIPWRQLGEARDLEFGFRQSASRREQTAKLLAMDKKSTGRKAVLKSLSDEVVRVYSRYVRLVQPGRPKSTFGARYPRAVVESVALALFKRNVAPGEFYQYWHDRIPHFKGNLKIVPLAFGNKASFIEDVVASMYDTDGEALEEEEVTEGNAFNAVTLDRGLRPYLTGLGFDLSGWNDQFLATLEVMARLKATKPGLFIADRVRPMVDATAEFHAH